MSSNLPRHHRAPQIYLITSGETTSETTPGKEDFARVVRTAEAAVEAGIDLLQIREKRLNTAVLYALTERIAAITRESRTKLLVNDRSDVAAAAGADGVHLTTSSLSPAIVRRAFGADFLIGVSTHSVAEARGARDAGANFIVFGPVFSTPEKDRYGAAQGLVTLSQVAAELSGFPVIALGGVTVERASQCLEAGAQGIAAIRALSDPSHLQRIVGKMRKSFDDV